ncbi:MAG: PDR/VanB family oxidoreductase [Galactobacter sp.]|uniref:PDR/VanB family oxidoreductase n=1 Tax=Galactobacter sp. TaxID=2676125 RepID=UPI0025B8F4F5|nr:PDR/VanB family oxidoreductase [Galactobacter sp.]
MSLTTASPGAHSSAAHSTTGDLCLTVTERREVARGVIAITLMDPDAARLPDWAPGAHVTLRLTDELAREYSLCGDRRDAQSYTIAVQREERGRGGSAWIHEHLTVGSEVAVSRPRNTFRLTPAERYLFVTGGIGITPVLPMIEAADAMGIPWRLLYLGHDRDRLAFSSRLEELGVNGVGARPWPGATAEQNRVLGYKGTSAQDGPRAVFTHVSAELGRCDLRRELGQHVDGRKVFACGPQALLDDLATISESWPAGTYRAERFGAGELSAPARTTPFDVVLSRSGRRVTVQPDTAVTDALRQSGVSVVTSCGEGVCGTCELAVLCGTPDHRDSVLEPAERDTAGCFFPCVSRSLSDELVVDL